MKPDCADITGAPSWSRRVWADGSHIFLEIPATSGPPLILKYEKCDGGLGKALAQICIAFESAPMASAKFEIKAEPKVKRGTYTPDKDFTDKQRKKAAAVLKKMGITAK